mmetsp:Transcript_47054/g.75614  ORF Transcript_47054/g.75614 Transcript_47054/m.75614 type:complete len:249 (+) Transcript_47054:158-904(+)
MSSLRNLIRRRIHKERSQPQSRAKFGLLEKKKDYKLRAIDYHRKQDHIHKLRKKAAFRNPDEFYFNMHNSQTEGGVHVLRRSIKRKHKEIKDANTQDLNYLQMKQVQEKRKIEKLKGELHLVEHGTKVNSHTIFVDKAEAVQTFNAAKHFDTVPELVDHHHNRVRTSDLERNKIDGEDETARKKFKRKRLKMYRELAARIDRKNALGRRMHVSPTPNSQEDPSLRLLLFSHQSVHCAPNKQLTISLYR